MAPLQLRLRYCQPNFVCKRRLRKQADGEQIGDMLWILFLGGTEHSKLRSFGDTRLDGL
jgi:hypothetical protein